MITFENEKAASAKIVEAMQSGDKEKMKQAWAAFHKSIADQVMEDFEAVQASNDSAILAQRGYRQLTSAETKWYQKLIEAGRSSNPKQAFVTILGSDNEEDLMPETIVEDVYKYLEDNHPLLSKINFQYVGYATKWILNDQTTQTAAWGTITDTITKQITGAFKVVDVHQNKLSAYAIIEKGMLDLGPTFLDGYIRRVLAEALANGLEYAIVKGTGKNMPIGLMMDIHKGVSVSDSTYSEKSSETYGAFKVTDFSPTSYGKLVAYLAVTEGGKQKVIRDLTMLCAPTDYYTKIMPATTVLNANGQYVNNLFPVPTDVIQSMQVPTGKAVLFIPSDYSLLAGGQRNGTIEYSDEYKFIEDQRVFKLKQYATGRAFDNHSALVIDISKLEAAYLNVKVNGSLNNTTVVSGEITNTPSA